MILRMFVPLFVIAVGVIWFFGSLLLPKSPLGNPNGPMYYPMVVSLFLVIMGLVYFVQEWKVRHKEKGVLKALREGRVLKLLISTIVLSILYTLIFEKISFLISTTLFLASLLFVINGFKKWLVNCLVAIIFTFILWYCFAQLLSISLP